jgi:hypothetical protein
MSLYLFLKKITPDLIKKLFNIWAEDREKELALAEKLKEIRKTKRKAKAIAKSIYQSSNLPLHFNYAIEDFKKKLPYDDKDLLELIRIQKNYIPKKPAAKRKPAAKKKTAARRLPLKK